MEAVVEKFQIPRSMHIKELDFFGEIPQFTIKKGESYQTVCGACVTFFFYTMFILILYYFTREFVINTPNLSKFTINDPESKAIDLNESGLMYSLVIYDSTSSSYTADISSKFDIEAVYMVQTNAGTTTTKFPFTKCSASTTFFEGIDDHQSSKAFKQFGMCLDKFPEESKLQGTIGSKINSIVSINVTPKASFLGSFTNEEIIIGIKEKYFHVTRPTNFESLKFDTQTIATAVKNNLNEMRITHRYQELTTQQGAIVPTSSEFEIVKPVVTSTILGNYQANGPVLVVVLEAGLQKEIIERSYMNILNYFAEVGGSMDGVIFIALILHVYYNTYFRDKYIREIIFKPSREAIQVFEHNTSKEINEELDEAALEVYEQAVSLENHIDNYIFLQMVQDIIMDESFKPLISMAGMVQMQREIEHEHHSKKVKKSDEEEINERAKTLVKAVKHIKTRNVEGRKFEEDLDKVYRFYLSHLLEKVDDARQKVIPQQAENHDMCVDEHDGEDQGIQQAKMVKQTNQGPTIQKRIEINQKFQSKMPQDENNQNLEIKEEKEKEVELINVKGEPKEAADIELVESKNDQQNP